MKKLLLVFLFFLLLIFTECSNHREISFLSQWDTTRVLANPGKGWYHHLLDNGINKYEISNDSVFDTFPGMDHVYLRIAWSYLEPEEGKFDWHYIDDVVKKYVQKGLGISFRISSKETGTYPGSVGQQKDSVQYANPYWVAKAGGKGIVVTSHGIKSWVPKWDDPVYLKKLDQFHKTFAARYDGQPWVRYVDIGSIGEWGEGHTFYSTKIPPTVKDVKDNIDIYLKNYKKSQLVAVDDMLYYGKPDSDVRILYEYATSNGLTLRDDSPMVASYIKNFLKTWSVSHPQFYNPLYLQKPVIFELQHYRSVKSDGNWLGKNGVDTIPTFGYSGADILRNAIKTMHATYIGYHGYAEDWLADNPDLTRELANRCGYWYFPVNASIPLYLVKGENTITFEWLNKGVAPAYINFGLILRFESRKQDNYFDLFIEYSGNRNWVSNINHKETYIFRIKDDIPAGRYNLKFKLVHRTKNDETVIDLGLKKEFIENNRFIRLCNVSVEE